MMVADTYQRPTLFPERKEKQWNAVFPAQQKEKEDCMLFISRMSYIALAEYLLHREIISPKVCKRRRIGDVVFHTFNRELRWGSKLSDMMRGIGEAIKLQYARQALIAINEDQDEQDLATEVFTITFAYNADDCLKIADENGNCVISMGYKGKETLCKQVNFLVKKIVAVCQRLKRFEGTVRPAIKLTYYDDRTPPDYQPFAFQHCETTYILKNAAAPQYHLGHIATNFAAAALDIQSVYVDDIDALESANMEGIDARESLDVTVDGDITLNDVTHAEIDEIQRSNSLEMMEVARHANEEDPFHVEDERAVYDESMPIQEEENDEQREPTHDTTNEDDYSPVKSRKKTASKEAKRKPPRSPIKKSAKTTSRMTRALAAASPERLLEQANLLVTDEQMINDETSGTYIHTKISKAFTSPENRRLLPNRRRMAAGRTFTKSSMVVRSVERSPSDDGN